MKQYTLLAACLSLAILLLACNKGKNDFMYKGDVLPVAFKGYNGSNEDLTIKLDTFTTLIELAANKAFDNSTAFTFLGNQQTVKLSISEKNTGKVILERELKKEDGLTKLNFFYLDGKIGDMPEKPAIDEGKLKLTYMFLPTVTNYSEPVDIAFVKYYWTPVVFEEMGRIKNLKPYEFSQPVTIPTFSTARQEYNGVMTTVSFLARIYKAGTNELYTEGSEYTWHVTSSTAPKPPASTANSKMYIFMEAPAGNSMRFFTRLDQ